ncbi:hypothetical protein Bca52824_017977 [Brassica carinata]|uniref:ER membrane protein complex subunit 10 n=1 Tax=Brassica carinata TaxID=52824 RepID=A0A8X7VP98_BRACI|nr:hypothetical protein Bca52824_017977 [Brassica carinata]
MAAELNLLGIPVVISLYISLPLSPFPFRRDSIKQKPTSSPFPSSKVVSFSSSSGTFSARLKSWSQSSLIKTNFDLCGVQTLTKLRFSSNGFSDQEKHTFKNLLKVDDFYRIRLPSNVISPPGKEFVVASVDSLRFVQEGAIILAVSYGSLVIDHVFCLVSAHRLQVDKSGDRWKLALKIREKITTTPRRDIKRESRREEKVVKAAVLDKTLTKLRFSSNGFSDQEKHTFKNLLKVDDFYRIRLPSNVISPPGKEFVVASVESLRFVQIDHVFCLVSAHRLQLYWPKLLQHKIKQKLTKMAQMRWKLALKIREKITTTPRRDIKRESRREEKVVKAAVLDKSTKVINKYHDQDTTDHVTSGFIDESEMQRH